MSFILIMLLGIIWLILDIIFLSEFSTFFFCVFSFCNMYILFSYSIDELPFWLPIYYIILSMLFVFLLGYTFSIHSNSIEKYVEEKLTKKKKQFFILNVIKLILRLSQNIFINMHLLKRRLFLYFFTNFCYCILKRSLFYQTRRLFFDLIVLMLRID